MITNFKEHLNKVLTFINSKKIKTISFENFDDDQVDDLLRTIREWFESSLVEVERIIIAINNNEHLLSKVENKMIKYFPPCKDTEFYNQYWEDEKNWLMNSGRKTESISGDDITKLFTDIHAEWRKKLEEAIKLSKETD